MSHMRKLSPEEVRTLEYRGKDQRKLIKEQNNVFLAAYSSGDYGEANLESDENRLTYGTDSALRHSDEGLIFCIRTLLCCGFASERSLNAVLGHPSPLLLICLWSPASSHTQSPPPSHRHSTQRSKRCQCC